MMEGQGDEGKRPPFPANPSDLHYHWGAVPSPEDQQHPVRPASPVANISKQHRIFP